MQRYESFSIIRLLNNTAPGKNGGGWVDLGGSQLNLTNVVEQCALTVLAKTPELTLWNFNSYVGSDVLPAVGRALQKIDDILDKQQLRQQMTAGDRDAIARAHREAERRTLWERITHSNHKDVTYYKGLLMEYTRDLLYVMREDVREEVKGRDIEGKPC